MDHVELDVSARLLGRATQQEAGIGAPQVTRTKRDGHRGLGSSG